MGAFCLVRHRTTEYFEVEWTDLTVGDAYVAWRDSYECHGARKTKVVSEWRGATVLGRCTADTTKWWGTMSVHVCRMPKLYRVWANEVRSVNTFDCEPDGHELCIHSVSDSMHACAGGKWVHARSSTDSVNRSTVGYSVDMSCIVDSVTVVPVMSDPFTITPGRF